MNSHSFRQNAIHIRDARAEDILGIVALIGTCAPYLGKHGSYLYLIYTRYYGETCSFAVEDGLIVGWCSVLPVKAGCYFLHQLGIAPEARGRGVAFALFSHILTKLRERHGEEFRLEFTADRKNKAVHHLNRKVAEEFHLNLQKLPEAVPPLEDGSDEELYEMTPLRPLDVTLHSAA